MAPLISGCGRAIHDSISLGYHTGATEDYSKATWVDGYIIFNYRWVEGDRSYGVKIYQGDGGVATPSLLLFLAQTSGQFGGGVCANLLNYSKETTWEIEQTLDLNNAPCPSIPSNCCGENQSNLSFLLSLADSLCEVQVDSDKIHNSRYEIVIFQHGYANPCENELLSYKNDTALKISNA